MIFDCLLVESIWGDTEKPKNKKQPTLTSEQRWLEPLASSIPQPCRGPIGDEEDRWGTSCFRDKASHSFCRTVQAFIEEKHLHKLTELQPHRNPSSQPLSLRPPHTQPHANTGALGRQAAAWKTAGESETRHADGPPGWAVD